MRTQVCIIGAGPAVLLLGHLLRAEGIECVAVERQAPDFIFERAMQVVELDYIASSCVMQTAIAENYVGLPV